MRATSSLLFAVKAASAVTRKVVPLADRILVRRIEQQAKVSSFEKKLEAINSSIAYYALHTILTITIHFHNIYNTLQSSLLVEFCFQRLVRRQMKAKWLRSDQELLDETER